MNSYFDHNNNQIRTSYFIFVLCGAYYEVCKTLVSYKVLCMIIR